MSACDHLLGIFSGIGEDEYVFESNRIKIAEEELEACQRWLAEGGGHPISNRLISALDTPEKALAARTDFFDFCPRCGEKLIAKQQMILIGYPGGEPDFEVTRLPPRGVAYEAGPVTKKDA